MWKKSILWILTCSFVAACGSKAKKPDEGAGVIGDSASDSKIVTNPMNFDASGSDSGKIAGLNTVFFPYDSAQLGESARKTLEENATWIKNNPDVVVQIEGHCDSRGSIEYNIALGERRANSVQKYLASLGIENKRMSVISYGEEKPLVSGDTEAAYAKNRRANFLPISR